MDLYLVFVVFLFVLAVTDLMVGVSNDAVNFLNSAVGSKVASRKVIMVVASLGIAIGATFSSGMMEVARKGIFSPDLFMFSEIMIIFLAVMITDIILLDAFNTLGMPTSTTVSIVFELLGAAVAVALVKTAKLAQPITELATYINWGSALKIITGIVASVFIAFLVGALVQYVVRLFFTFRIQKRMATIGILWSGISTAFIGYFLLIKGAKGSSLISDDMTIWIGTHQYTLLGSLFLGACVLMWVLHQFGKINPLKVVVLTGTFALAMAFAGNDLVNFIGVPIAGLFSYNAYTAGGDPTILMSALSEKIRTNPMLLLGAGIIMVVTLLLSKKARTVTETEVNLGRQNAGEERFQPNVVSRVIVDTTLRMRGFFTAIAPSAFFNFADRRYREKDPLPKQDPPAFDLVRASVNLTVASILIAIATSYKLPLSTTYVSFMVAMGTSLSDRAWDSGSAVYRVAGVAAVIGGWFATALIAFTVAGSFALIMMFAGKYGVFILMTAAALVILKTSLYHASREKEKQMPLPIVADVPSGGDLHGALAAKLSEVLDNMQTTFSLSMEGVLENKASAIGHAEKQYKKVRSISQRLSGKLYDLVTDREEPGKIDLWHAGLTERLSFLQRSLAEISDACARHVRNRHPQLESAQRSVLSRTSSALLTWVETAQQSLHATDAHTRQDWRALAHETQKQLEHIHRDHIRQIKRAENGPRANQLLWFVIWETKNLVDETASLCELIDDLCNEPSATGTTTQQLPVG